VSIKPIWTLLQGGCVEVMHGMADDSFDAIVCDPPYGLEFMGKEWDSLDSRARIRTRVDGRTNGAEKSVTSTPEAYIAGTPMQRWHQAWATEALRVLKPGGHMLAFGGTRTFHRLVCAVEDAGFEIRDTIAWMYGCLDDKTEIFVDGRWRRHHGIKEGQHAICYDQASDEFSYQAIERVVAFQYDDTAYCLVSDRTDQLVTKEHRCLVERDGGYVFCEAQDIARQRQVRVPLLEDMQDLLDALSVPQSDSSDTQCDLFSGMRVGEHIFRESWEDSAGASQTDDPELSGMRDGVRDSHMQTEESKNSDLFTTMQRGVAGGGVGEARVQGSVGLDGGVSEISQCKDDWTAQPGMEGWSSGAQAGEVCQLPIEIYQNGSQGRLRNGASTPSGSGTWASSKEDGGSASHRSQLKEQPANKPRTIQVKQGPQAVRASRFTTSDLVRVQETHYEGIAWCITVPTGAFVARRNGKVFITGNSGFPKSLDVGKAIDRQLGSQRPVAGRGVAIDRNALDMGGSSGKAKNGLRKEWARSEAITPEAAQWAGFGTALKPAHEPIVVARKPLIGTVAKNVLTYGTGALNIDASRIGTESTLRVKSGGLRDFPHEDDAWKPRSVIAGHEHGRWPANVILDEEAGAILDAQTSRLHARVSGSRPKEYKATSYKIGDAPLEASFTDSGGASRFFKNIQNEEVCELCRLSFAESAGMSLSQRGRVRPTAHGHVLASQQPARGVKNQRKVTSAASAALSLSATEVGSTAPPNAPEQLGKWIVRCARSVVNLCDSCAIDIAQNVVLSLRDPTPALQAGPATTLGLKKQILSQSLALAAAGARSTGIIPTTTILSALCGSVVGATIESTTVRDAASGGVENTRLRYEAKASKSERTAGLPDGMAASHPTVKPINLMRYLVRLVTPPGGVVLDPFAGSGTTLIAAQLEGFDSVGIERELEYVELIRARCEHWASQ
jgi:DNA modification methylase